MARQFRKVSTLARPTVYTALLLRSARSRELDLDSLLRIVSTSLPPPLANATLPASH
jgi:hypothetical protein